MGEFISSQNSVLTLFDLVAYFSNSSSSLTHTIFKKKKTMLNLRMKHLSCESDTVLHDFSRWLREKTVKQR